MKCSDCTTNIKGKVAWKETKPFCNRCFKKFKQKKRRKGFHTQLTRHKDKGWNFLNNSPFILKKEIVDNNLIKN